VAGFGIKVTLVEPGSFATDWGGSSAAFAEQLPAYAAPHEAVAADLAGVPTGDPTAAGPALLEVVEAENSPLRVSPPRGPGAVEPVGVLSRVSS
jgi:NAD(P)-dependent dehydrogenase (short-subunit alcohol dehydrogenase family)